MEGLPVQVSFLQTHAVRREIYALCDAADGRRSAFGSLAYNQVEAAWYADSG